MCSPNVGNQSLIQTDDARVAMLSKSRTTPIVLIGYVGSPDINCFALGPSRKNDSEMDQEDGVQQGVPAEGNCRGARNSDIDEHREDCHRLGDDSRL